jgi:hypothetical protein
MTSYRRIISKTLNKSTQQQDNMMNFMTPISRANYPNYFSVPDASNNSLLVSTGSNYSASASSKLKFDGTTFNVNGNLAITNTISNKTGLIAPSITEKTLIANGFSGTLIKNIHFLAPANGASITAQLPSIATSTLGDVIIVEYKNIINNAAVHKYGTSGEYFMAESSCYIPTAGALTYAISSANGTTHDFLNLTGLTNAGPGIGTYVIFTFNGVQWRVEARCTTSGTGAVLGTSAFALT